MKKIVTTLVIGFTVVVSTFFFLQSNDDKFESTNVENDVLKKAGKIKESETGELSRAQKIVDLIDSTNFSIDFHGKVVDENNQPVDAATVNYTVRKGELDIKGSVRDALDHGSVLTNSSGDFLIRDKKGYALSIDGIEKEGYRFIVGNEINFNSQNIIENKSVSYTLVKNENILLFTKYYRLHSKWEGSPIYLNLRLGQVDDVSDLVLIPIRNKKDGRRFDWEFSVECLSGGIVEATQGNRAIAPSDGYTLKWNISYSEKDEDYSVGSDVNTFVKMSDGNYAKVQFSLRSDVVRESIPSIKVRVFINELGGRVLDDGSTNSKY